MQLNEYQTKAAEFARYPEKYGPIYPTLGLMGEAGEVCEKIKKHLRGDGPLNIEDIKKELGDVLWYLSNLSRELGITLEDVATTNIAKLADRRARSVLKGSGDNR